MTTEQRENLKKLAYYLLNELKADFDMCEFGDDYCCWTSITCGSVGCAIGHGPYAGITKINYEGWSTYAHRVFGVAQTGDTHFIRKYLFDSDWKMVDNTPVGAARRIIRYLSSGIPEGFVIPHKDYVL